MQKTFPRVKTDAEIEALLADDLSDYLYSRNFQPVTFEFKAKKGNFNY
ncbi:CopG family antitoxin [Dolichospermum sp. UHCC 0259]|nr:CopG family antitoxin [Dolichospermum sp. UHCC 0259]